MTNDDVAKVLDDLKDARIEGALVVMKDGSLIVNNLPDSIHKDIFGVMAATILGASETAIQELKRYKLEHIIIKSSGSNIVIVEVKPKALLGVIVKADIDVETVMSKIVHARIKIEKLI